MKTTSTKLDDAQHEYLHDIARNEGITVSSVLRNMVDRLIQGEYTQERVYVDKDHGRKIRELELEMDKLCRLQDQDLPEYKTKINVNYLLNY